MFSRYKTIFAVCALGSCGLGLHQFNPQRAVAQGEIERAAKKTFIVGRVYDARTKKGIAGAEISWEGGGDLFETTTDAQGNYRVDHVVPVEKSDSLYYAYAVKAPGYSARSNYTAFGFENVKIWVPKDGLQIDFAMRGQTAISGQLKDSAGQTVAGAHVHAYSENGNNSEIVATDKSGRWRVDKLDVPIDSGVIALTIEAFDRRYSQVEGKATARADQEAQIAQVMPARATIRGRLTRSGKPLANAYVQVDFEEGRGYINGDSNYGLPRSIVGTDKNGNYRLSVSAPKKLQLEMSEYDSIGQRIAVQTRPGQTVVVNRDLKPFPYGSIAGRVTDFNGKPLSGGSIELWNNDTSQANEAATTDKAGRFFVAKVGPRDDWHATVALPGRIYSSSGSSDVLRVRPRQTTNVTIRIDAQKPALVLPDPPRVVSGTVKVKYQVSDNRGVKFVALALDGGDLNDSEVYFEQGKNPRQTSGAIVWNTRRSPNGRHRLRVEAADEAGNVTRREWFVWIQNQRAPAVK